MRLLNYETGRSNSIKVLPPLRMQPPGTLDTSRVSRKRLILSAQRPQHDHPIPLSPKKPFLDGLMHQAGKSRKSIPNPHQSPSSPIIRDKKQLLQLSPVPTTSYKSCSPGLKNINESLYHSHGSLSPLLDLLEQKDFQEAFFYVLWDKEIRGYQVVDYDEIRGKKKYLTVGGRTVTEQYEQDDVERFTHEQWREKERLTACLSKIGCGRLFRKAKFFALWRSKARQACKQVALLQYKSSNIILCDPIFRTTLLEIQEMFHSLIQNHQISYSLVFTSFETLQQSGEEFLKRVSEGVMILQDQLREKVECCTTAFLKQHFRFYDPEKEIREYFVSEYFAVRTEIKFILGEIKPVRRLIEALYQTAMMDLVYDNLTDLANRIQHCLSHQKSTLNWSLSLTTKNNKLSITPSIPSIKRYLLGFIKKLVRVISSLDNPQHFSGFHYGPEAELVEIEDEERTAFDGKMWDYRDIAGLMERVELMIDDGEDLVMEQLQLRFAALAELAIHYFGHCEVPDPSEDIIVQIYHQIQIDFQRLTLQPEQYPTPFGPISLSTLKTEISECIFQRKKFMSVHFPKKIQGRLDQLTTGVNKLEDDIVGPISTIEQYVENIETTEHASLCLEEYGVEIKLIRKTIDCLHLLGVESGTMHRMRELDRHLLILWNKILSWQTTRTNNYQSFRSQLSTDLMRSRIIIESLIQRLSFDFYNSAESDTKSCYFELKRLGQEVAEARQQYERNRMVSVPFGMDVGDDKDLRALESESSFIYAVWKLRWDFNIFMEQVKPLPIASSSSFKQKYMAFKESANELAHNHSSSQIAQHVRQQIHSYQDLQLTLETLNYPYIHKQHFNSMASRLSKVSDHDFKGFPKEVFHTLDWAMYIDLPVHLAILQQVAARAFYQDQAQQVFQIIKYEWYHMTVAVQLSEYSSYLQLLPEQNQDLLARLKLNGSALGQAYNHAAEDLLKDIQVLQEGHETMGILLSGLIELQELVSTVGAFFERACDGLSKHAKLVQESRELMDSCCRVLAEYPYKLAQQDGQKGTSTKLKSKINSFQGTMSEFQQRLVQSREKNPRMFRLSDLELVTLLNGDSKSLSFLNEYMPILYGFRLRGKEGAGLEVVGSGVVVKEGVPEKSGVEEWLMRFWGRLILRQKELVMELLQDEEACSSVLVEDEHSQHISLQLLLLFQNIIFTKDSESFLHPEQQSPASYKYKELAAQLSAHLKNLFKHKVISVKLEVQALQLIVQRDQAMKLCHEEVKECGEFGWACRLRWYGQERGEVSVHVLQERMEYGWEPVSDCEVVVVIEMPVSFVYHVFTNKMIELSAPMHTGKLSMLRSLAMLTGRPTFRLPQNRRVSTIMEGAQRTGTWLLSNNSFQTMQKSLQVEICRSIHSITHPTNFRFFLLHNSNNSTTIPLYLADQFRTIAVPPPDLKELIVWRLTALGFSQAMWLAPRLKGLLEHMEAEFGWGAGACKQRLGELLNLVVKDVNEVHSIGDAVLRGITPGLDTEHLQLANELVSLYLAPVKQIQLNYPSYKKTTRKQVFESPSWLLKRQQLEQALNSNRAICIIGAPDVGKSTFLHHHHQIVSPRATLLKVNLAAYQSHDGSEKKGCKVVMSTLGRLVESTRSDEDEGCWLVVEEEMINHAVEMLSKGLAEGVMRYAGGSLAWPSQTSCIFLAHSSQQLSPATLSTLSLIYLQEDITPRQEKIYCLLREADQLLQEKLLVKLVGFLEGISWKRVKTICQLWVQMCKEFLMGHFEVSKEAKRNTYEKIMFYLLAMTEGLQVNSREVFLPANPRKYRLDFLKHHSGDFTELNYEDPDRHLILCKESFGQLFLLEKAFQTRRNLLAVAPRGIGKTAVLTLAASIFFPSSTITLSNNHLTSAFKHPSLLHQHQTTPTLLYIDDYSLPPLHPTTRASIQFTCRNSALTHSRHQPLPIPLHECVQVLVEVREGDEFSAGSKALVMPFYYSTGVYYQQVSKAMIMAWLKPVGFSYREVNRLVDQTSNYLLEVLRQMQQKGQFEQFRNVMNRASCHQIKGRQSLFRCLVIEAEHEWGHFLPKINQITQKMLGSDCSVRKEETENVGSVVRLGKYMMSERYRKLVIEEVKERLVAAGSHMVLVGKRGYGKMTSALVACSLLKLKCSVPSSLLQLKEELIRAILSRFASCFIIRQDLSQKMLPLVISYLKGDSSQLFTASSEVTEENQKQVSDFTKLLKESHRVVQFIVLEDSLPDSDYHYSQLVGLGFQWFHLVNEEAELKVIVGDEKLVEEEVCVLIEIIKLGRTEDSTGSFIRMVSLYKAIKESYNQRIKIQKEESNLVLFKIKQALDSIIKMEARVKIKEKDITDISRFIQIRISDLADLRRNIKKEETVLASLQANLEQAERSLGEKKQQVDAVRAEIVVINKAGYTKLINVSRAEIIEFKKLEQLHPLQQLMLEMLAMLFGVRQQQTRKLVFEGNFISKALHLHPESISQQSLELVHERLAITPEFNSEGIERLGEFTYGIGGWLIQVVEAGLKEKYIQRRNQEIDVEEQEVSQLTVSYNQQEDKLISLHHEQAKQESAIEQFRFKLETARKDLLDTQKSLQRAGFVKERMSELTDQWKMKHSQLHAKSLSVVGDCLLAFGEYTLLVGCAQDHGMMEKKIRGIVQNRFTIDRDYSVLDVLAIKEEEKVRFATRSQDELLVFNAFIQRTTKHQAVLDPRHILRQQLEKRELPFSVTHLASEYFNQILHQCTSKGTIMFLRLLEVPKREVQEFLNVPEFQVVGKTFISYRKRLFEVHEGFRVVLLLESQKEMEQLPSDVPMLDFSLSEELSKSQILKRVIRGAQKSYKEDITELQLSEEQKLSSLESRILKLLLSDKPKILQSQVLDSTIPNLVHSYNLKKKEVREKEVLAKNQSLFAKAYSSMAGILNRVFYTQQEFSCRWAIYHVELSQFVQIIDQALLENLDHSITEHISNLEDRMNGMLEQMRRKAIPAILAKLKAISIPEHLLAYSVILEAIADNISQRHFDSLLGVYEQFAINEKELALVKQLGLARAREIRLLKNSHFSLVEKITMLEKDPLIITEGLRNGSVRGFQKFDGFDRLLLFSKLFPGSFSEQAMKYAKLDKISRAKLIPKGQVILLLHGGFQWFSDGSPSQGTRIDAMQTSMGDLSDWLCKVRVMEGVFWLDRVEIFDDKQAKAVVNLLAHNVSPNFKLFLIARLSMDVSAVLARFVSGTIYLPSSKEPARTQSTVFLEASQTLDEFFKQKESQLFLGWMEKPWRMHDEVRRIEANCLKWMKQEMRESQLWSSFADIFYTSQLTNLNDRKTMQCMISFLAKSILKRGKPAQPTANQVFKQEECKQQEFIKTVKKLNNSASFSISQHHLQPETVHEDNEMLEQGFLASRLKREQKTSPFNHYFSRVTPQCLQLMYHSNLRSLFLAIRQTWSLASDIPMQDVGIELAFVKKEGIELLGISIQGAGVSDGLMSEGVEYSPERVWVLPCNRSKKRQKKDGTMVAVGCYSVEGWCCEMECGSRLLGQQCYLRGVFIWAQSAVLHQ